MPHVVLVGDSIFDNRAYTGGAPDVIAHLQAMLPPDWRATLCAVDGATTATLLSQLARVPQDATHLVIAIGGNDALRNIDLLSTRVRSTAEALTLFANRVATFEESYSTAMSAAAALSVPLTLCTIYNGRLDAAQAPLARIALMMFNDVIIRTAFSRRAGVVDLRTVCADPADYANPIEPSDGGGRKIASAIARCVGAIEPDAMDVIRVATS
jgi:hypothetical protein